MKFNAKLTALVFAVAAVAPLAAQADVPGEHPAYMHALSDLRAARWLIDHHPPSYAQGADEAAAVRQIDDAIRDLKQAAIDDGKDVYFHPPVDERPDMPGRLHGAVDALKKARADIDREEDNGWARGLRNRSIQHIDDALHHVRRAIHEE
jgi:hypothetical protein